MSNTTTTRHHKMDENTYAIFVGNYQHLTAGGKAEARAEAARRNDDVLTRLYGIPKETPRAAKDFCKRIAYAERTTRALDAALLRVDEETRSWATAHIRIAIQRIEQVFAKPNFGDFGLNRDVDRLFEITTNLRHFIPDPKLAQTAVEYVDGNAGMKDEQ